MTREQMFFVQMLSDHLNTRRTEPVDDIDWNIIHLYAQRHLVSGIIYAQAKKILPETILGAFQQETIATYYNYSYREEDVKTIKHIFTEENIPFFLVKGPVIAEKYPIPELRAMGDIDLVVHPEDREKCHAILCKNGFVSQSKQKDREWQYYKNSLETELHDRLVYKEAVNEKDQDEYFNNCWQYVQGYQLDWNFHLLFLIFHLRKHLMNSGAGFRQFMDLAVAAQATETDWKWIKQGLKETGMLTFAQRCYGFINQWFGIETPIMEEIDEQFFNEATKKIFADGIFGFDNADNADSAVINRVRKKRFSSLRMLSIAIRYVFLPIDEMKSINEYSYLKKAPILLPIAWIHRIVFSASKNKKRNAISNLKKSFVSKDKIVKRDDMMKKWGL